MWTHFPSCSCLMAFGVLAPPSLSPSHFAIVFGSHRSLLAAWEELLTEDQGNLEEDPWSLNFSTFFFPSSLHASWLLRPGEGLEHPSHSYCIYLGVAENRGQQVS
ncbi:Hypothetical predicted protein [Marmota monax]|uniref:Secreted protein n=1 Tax=Marmota monax TaxID=9995 RepID=A0A5E4BH56_MARMO|nr:hypothetical protein GHT09_003975 [Marmota monax]VTJ68596.1 Hypothetical predicted protein [Marmota monax]